jgi:D-alanine-D-alanine ligase
MRVGITYNLRKDFPLLPDQPIDAFEEFDAEETIDAIRDVLESKGHIVVKLGGSPDLIGRLAEHRVEIVFNVAEGLRGRSREAHIPALLEFLDIPYTGSDPLTLALTLDKLMAKRVVQSEGIPTPRFKKIETFGDLATVDLSYPLFVKPCYEGSSKGIRLDSKVTDRASLERKTRSLLSDYRSSLLVEEFVDGPEFTVGILGNRDAFVLGIMQIEITGVPQNEAVYSLEVKRDWVERVRYHCPPLIEESARKRIAEVALRSYKALDCRDVSRVDVRMGRDGVPYFLEVNPLPGLSPSYGDLPIMARRMGWEYARLVGAIFDSALARYGFPG